MPSSFLDTNAPLPGEPAALPHGLVKPPEEVAEQVARERVKFPPEVFDDTYAKRALDDLTLAYFYEGIPVAYRSVAEGVEVLAVGADEIGALVKGLSQEELLTFTVKQP